MALRAKSRRGARLFAVAGPLLRLLRAGRGWTQLEAAERAGLSERLLRKAEAGEAIESQSIAILARLYSKPAAPLTANDLLAQPASTSSLSSDGDGQGSSWVRVDGGLLREGWDYWDQQRVVDAAREACG